MTEELNLKNLMISYNLIVDGKDKKTIQTFKNTKLTSTSDDLYYIGSKMIPLLSCNGAEITKIEHYSLSE